MTLQHGLQVFMLSYHIPFIGYDNGAPDFPKITTSTAIGIATAITGNILISLALNLQKLAHRRVETEALERLTHDRHDNTKRTRRRGREDPSLNEADEDYSAQDLPSAPQSSRQANHGNICSSPTEFSTESQPLLQFPVAPEYNGTSNGSIPSRERNRKRSSILTRAIRSTRWVFSLKGTKEPVEVLPVHVVTAGDRTSRKATGGNGEAVDGEAEALDKDRQENEGEYLKSKLWWFGFALMNIGELGNFISYAFAPASVVAPLGTFALIANCFFSPVILKERFRKRDLIGVAIAIVGAVTVVLAINASDIRLDPDELIKAISQKAFIAYSVVYIVGVIVLSTLSHGPYGRRYVAIDVGLCAFFGGFTVLSTKAISTLLTLQWIDMFKSWITYPVFLVLVGTGVGQVRYLNRALMRFDSKVVIPSQFVFFNLSAIAGSAILYGDFKTATFHQMLTFLYGCAATFAGVFVIAWAPMNGGSTDQQGSEADIDLPANGSIESDSRILGTGSVSRRRHATLVLPNGANPYPILRHKQSSLSLMGLSPAQHLLLVHTPPNTAYMPMGSDAERDVFATPDSTRRRRAVTWFAGSETTPNTTRDSSLMARR